MALPHKSMSEWDTWRKQVETDDLDKKYTNTWMTQFLRVTDILLKKNKNYEVGRWAIGAASNKFNDLENQVTSA